MAGYAVYIDKEAQSWQIAQSDHTVTCAVWRGHGWAGDGVVEEFLTGGRGAENRVDSRQFASAPPDVCRTQVFL